MYKKYWDPQQTLLHNKKINNNNNCCCWMYEYHNNDKNVKKIYTFFDTGKTPVIYINIQI